MLYVFNIESLLNCFFLLCQTLVFKYDFFQELDIPNPFGRILSINKKIKELYQIYHNFFCTTQTVLCWL